MQDHPLHMHQLLLRKIQTDTAAGVLAHCVVGLAGAASAKVEVTEATACQVYEWPQEVCSTTPNTNHSQ